ncbi:hypothetical protein L1787_02270 [Acuticoccus sp. M5D2P5]|uniref:hypothetical protein n=1 Tax=Acuticoccus kalidii TaxID=2910977 RepID=UPI001F32A6C8|nr:hypothetical protein [Acuticoccus kalidii]MCF3932240.1 hypothetical protein [Acuticoccus kalidii]
MPTRPRAFRRHLALSFAAFVCATPALAGETVFVRQDVYAPTTILVAPPATQPCGPPCRTSVVTRETQAVKERYWYRTAPAPAPTVRRPAPVVRQAAPQPDRLTCTTFSCASR